MTTAAELVERTRRYLMNETRPRRNRLSAGINASVTSLMLEFETSTLGPGSEISIGLEEMFVWAVSGQTLTVSRGENGTTASTHATGDLIEINSKFSTSRIFDALNEEIGSLSSPSYGLFAVATVDLTYNPAVMGYDLTSSTDVIDVLEVKYDITDASESWPVIPASQWRLKRDMDTGEFASGNALIVYGWAESGQTIRVSYKTGFTALATLADVAETVTNLPATAIDIPPIGAAMRLIAGSEVNRNFLDQGDTRRADEVAGGARASSIQNLAALRRGRISDEAAALMARYPIVMA